MSRETAITGFGETRTLTPSEQAKVELLELGEAGYRIFRPDDLTAYKQWLAAEDGTCWILLGGMPLSGYRQDTHAILLGKNNSWAYLTSAAASGLDNAPRDRRELEERARKAGADAKAARDERERELTPLRKQAQPVTIGTLDSALGMTLAEAADRIRNAGGTSELRRDGELIVSLPPSAGGAWGAPRWTPPGSFTSPATRSPPARQDAASRHARPSLRGARRMTTSANLRGLRREEFGLWQAERLARTLDIERRLDALELTPPKRRRDDTERVLYRRPWCWGDKTRVTRR